MMHSGLLDEPDQYKVTFPYSLDKHGCYRQHWRKRCFFLYFNPL